MKKYILVILPLAALTSCSEIEETINQQIEKTTTSVKEQAQNAVKETLDDTISNSINSLTNAEHAQFQEVFPKGEPTMISDFKGKKFSFPNGSPAYVFKYKADKDLLIPYLEQQETLDEEKSDKVAKKIDVVQNLQGQVSGLQDDVKKKDGIIQSLQYQIALKDSSAQVQKLAEKAKGDIRSKAAQELAAMSEHGDEAAQEQVSSEVPPTEEAQMYNQEESMF